MYARVNIIFGRRDKVDDGLAHLEESDRGAVESTAGNLGLTTFVDREAGVIVAVSYWDEPAHSSEAVLTRAREGAAAAAGGDLVVESYEVAAQDRRSVPSSGATVRVERVQIDSSKIADGVAFIRDEVLPQLRTGAGFCSAELLIDRGCGHRTVAHRVDHRCRRRPHRHGSPRAAGRGRGAGRDQVPPDRDLYPGAHLRPRRLIPTRRYRSEDRQSRACTAGLPGRRDGRRDHEPGVADRAGTSTLAKVCN